MEIAPFPIPFAKVDASFPGPDCNSGLYEVPAMLKQLLFVILSIVASMTEVRSSEFEATSLRPVVGMEITMVATNKAENASLADESDLYFRITRVNGAGFLYEVTNSLNDSKSQLGVSDQAAREGRGTSLLTTAEDTGCSSVIMSKRMYRILRDGRTTRASCKNLIKGNSFNQVVHKTGDEMYALKINGKEIYLPAIRVDYEATLEGGEEKPGTLWILDSPEFPLILKIRSKKSSNTLGIASIYIPDAK